MTDQHFINIFKKFINGSHWLQSRSNSGIDTTADRQEFEAQVVRPMDQAWLELDDAQREFWTHARRTAEVFEARMV